MSAYPDNDTNVTCKVVLSIALVIFVCIICYHVYLRIKNYKIVKKLGSKGVETLLIDHKNEDIRNCIAAYEISEIAT